MKKPDPVARVPLRLIHRASRDIRRPRQQLAMRDELGEGFDVENAGADHWAVLVGSKGAAKRWDGGVEIADTDTLLQVDTVS